MVVERLVSLGERAAMRMKQYPNLWDLVESFKSSEVISAQVNDSKISDHIQEVLKNKSKDFKDIFEKMKICSDTMVDVLGTDYQPNEYTILLASVAVEQMEIQMKS
jgi:hypothetical protein